MRIPVTLLLAPVLAPIFASLLAAPAAAQDAAAIPLTLEQRMLLRCSAAVALVANRQQGGEAWALEYPPLAQRGQEFFVISTAKVMEEAALDDAQVQQLLRTEAQTLLDDQLLPDIMPVCLRFLEGSGL